MCPKALNFADLSVTSCLLSNSGIVGNRLCCQHSVWPVLTRSSPGFYALLINLGIWVWQTGLSFVFTQVASTLSTTMWGGYIVHTRTAQGSCVPAVRSWYSATKQTHCNKILWCVKVYDDTTPVFWCLGIVAYLSNPLLAISIVYPSVL